MKMKYTPKIRLLSFLLCVILVFGLFPPLTAQAAQVSRIYTKEELATGGISLIPQALTADSSFMGNYVNNGGRMSLNGHFSKYGSQNADGAGSTLPTGTIDGESSDHWYASYKWDPSPAQRDVIDRKDVKLEFRANMIPVYSTHNYVVKKVKHWAVSGIRLTRGDGNGNNTWVYGESDYGWKTNGDIIFKALAEKTNSGQPQAVSQTWDSYPAGDKAMFYNAYYLKEHNCCNPKTSGALFYAVEAVAPTITGMEFGSAKDGDSYTAIPRGGLTDTVTIHFSEKIRFADNAAHENIKLVLDAEYLDQSDKTGGFDITADFVEMGETYMKFRFTVREDYKHIKITGLDANQPDLMKETTLKVFDGNGDDLGASGLKATSVITDLAGNSLVYTRPYATQYYDGVAPTLSKIEMSGRDISAVSSAPTSWDDNSGNRRFIYGGAGDTITFQAVFSESVRVSDTGNVKAVLSIQDENGDPITLGWKDLDGNTVTFEDLVITEEMLDAGDRIYITKIEGMTVADYAGNACVTSLTDGLKNKAMVPAQSITLDVDKPQISSTIPADYIESSDPLVYRPYADAAGGEYFSFPVSFRDFDNNGADKSGVAGMDMQFSLDMVDSGSYNYWWAMDTNQNVGESTQWKNGTTGSPNTFPDLAEDRQYWVHIRLDSNVDYNYSANLSAGVSGVRFDGILNFSSVSDWAGNKATEGTSYALRHQVDNKNPTCWSDTVKLTPDYDNGQVTFSTRILGRDTYGIKKISYRWQIKPWGSPESEYAYVNEGEWTEITPDEPGLNKEFWIEPSFTYDYTAEGAFRSGQVRVEFMVEDLSGNMAGGESYIFKGRTGSFDYELASSRSSVTNNKPAEPVALPQVSMSEPHKPTGSTTENPPRSLLIIPLPDSMNAEGAYTEFYIWDPWHWDTNGEENGTGEMQYVDNPIAAIEEYLNDQTGLHSFDLAEIIQGSYYRAEGTVDTEANSATFESLTPYYSKNALQKMWDFFTNYYGRMDLYIVTTSSLEEFTYLGHVQNEDGSASVQDPRPADLSFTGAQSTVQTYTVYLANNPAYKIVTESITNAEGLTDAENEAYKLDYSASHRPAASLDNVAVTVQITNERDAGAALGEGFGLELLDYSYHNGAFRLYYTGSSRPGRSKPDSEPVKTWNLRKTSDGRQTIVFAPGTCTKNGWYTLWLETEDTHNGLAIEQELGQFFLDATVLDVQAAAIEKYYSAGESGESYEWKIEDVETAAQEDGTIKVGLAPTPDGWTMSEATISFRTEERPSDDPAAPTEMAQLRVYNQTYNVQKGLNLDAGEWRAVREDWEQTHSYAMYLADLSEETPYAAVDENGATEYRLPFVDGRNLIVYEIQSTNGVVTSHELVVDVAAQAEKWNLEYEVFYANRPGFATSAQVWPTGAYGKALDLNTTDDLDRTKYNFHQVNDKNYENTHYEDSYTYADDVENLEYYLVDPNGNVSTKTLTIYDTDGTVLNIDSGEPDVYLSVDSSHPMYASSDSGYYSDYDGDGKTFYFTIEASDTESSVDLREITLTFDEAYSAVLPGNCGTVGADGRVTMPLPLALDEKGELLKNADGTYAVWEDFGTTHNGIFHTQVVETEEWNYWTEEMETVTKVHVFGTWRYSVTEEELATLGDTRTLTVNVYDAHGNVTSVSNTYLYDTSDAIGIGYPQPLDWQDGYILGDGLTPEGVVGIYSQVPYASINGYGADDMFAFRDNGHLGLRYYTWEAPMITQDSAEPYQFTVTDLFGQTYTAGLAVTQYGELGIDVRFSTTEPTNQSVTVYAEATGNIEKIASIMASDGTVGTIDPLDPSKASITVSDNCTITVTTDADPASERKVKVTNIDKTLGKAYVLYYDQDYRLLVPGASAESVMAVLACDSEPLYVTNGPESYTFPAGSKAGDSYIFEYQDAAGNTGTITAVLPVNLTAPAEEDKEAPDVTVSLYAGKRNAYTFIDRFENPGFDEIAQESQVTAQLNDPANGGVRARTFRLILTIDDASETKVVVAPAGSTAPTDFDSAVQGSTAQNVTLAVSRNTATVDVDQNTAFDIHIIDEKGFVTTLKQIRITSIDDQAPVLTPKYEVGIDPETGYSVVTATFYPTEQEKFAEIIPLNAGVASRQETVMDADGKEVNVVRYYHVFLTNGSYTFNYEDDLGNRGTASAQVNALTTDAARVLSVAWYGTRKGAVGNVLPEQSELVNRDITAQLRMSKAISDVELFVYDESAPNHCGAKLDANAPVRVSFNASTIDVIYTGNVAHQVVVRFTASGNGRKGTEILPAVTCIDKSMPQVELKSAELSADKRSITFTFESSEEVLFSLDMGKKFATTHQWIARDNEPVTLYFTDKAGNQLSYPVTDFTGMDLTELEASYSASADGSNPTDEPALKLELKVGDSLFVHVNKDAEANLNGKNLGQFKANAWNEILLPEDAGVYMLELTDVSTGDTLMQPVFARAVDRIAPVIELASSTVLVHRNDSPESMMQSIRDGVTVTDNVDTDLDFTVTGYPETTQEGGLYSLTYTARDSAGNQVSADRYLYIIDEKTPILWINGEAGLPYSTVYLSAGDVKLTMEHMDALQDQPVVIKLRKGLHTTGQMKYYATTVEDMAFQVTETGHYTIYVRGQDRTEFVTYIYVEG